MTRASLLPIALLFAVYGCAERYGGLQQSATIVVRTQPPERKFSIVSVSEAKQAIGAESGDVPLASAGSLKSLLDKKAVLIAGDSPVTWNAGSYAVAVQCPTAYKVRLVTLERGTPKTLDIKC
jgi:hypothetical protein